MFRSLPPPVTAAIARRRTSAATAITTTARRHERSSPRTERSIGTRATIDPRPSDLARRYYRAMGERADSGYFPRGESVLRRVHEERAVGLLYGQRSLLLQATHPVAFTGLLASTSGTDAPFQRLVRTAKMMETIYFGSRADADRITGAVRRMHSRVRGTTDRPAGPHPAGTPYSADDPQFLLWILACLADSALVLHRVFVGDLDAADRERFWDDYLLVGELFGLPREHAPASYGEFRDYMRERLASRDLFVTEEARELGRRVAFDLPLPATRRAALPAINLAVTGSMPSRVRRLYGIAWSPAHEAAYQAIVRSHRLSRPVVPLALKRGSVRPRLRDGGARGEAPPRRRRVDAPETGRAGARTELHKSR